MDARTHDSWTHTRMHARTRAHALIDLHMHGCTHSFLSARTHGRTSTLDGCHRHMHVFIKQTCKKPVRAAKYSGGTVLSSKAAIILAEDGDVDGERGGMRDQT